jgi:type VI secretion system secreted protein VgrG
VHPSQPPRPGGSIFVIVSRTTHAISIESKSFSNTQLRVRSLRGRERIGKLFEFEVELVILEGAGPERAELIAAPVTLVFAPQEGEGDVHRVHTHIFSRSEDLNSAEGPRVLRLTLVPRAAALAAIETSETFVNQSVPDVVRHKLEIVSLEHEGAFRLRETYAPREFIAQYQESELSFVSRLCEHLGISFFFEHGDKSSDLVFTDHAEGFPLFLPQPLARVAKGAEGVGVHALSVAQRAVGRIYAVHDYNELTPLVDLTAEHVMADGHGGGVIEFGTHHRTLAEAAALAKVRAEHWHALEFVYEGRSNEPRLHAGQRVRIEAGPHHDALSLCIIEVEHAATQTVAGFDATEVAYQNSFKAILADKTFRPPRETPKPRIAGVFTGTIDPGVGVVPGPYASLDVFGRYLVKFHFDVQHPGDRPASCPVRMLQNHAGSGYGTHFPLKPGTEVAVAFIGGDPDRPIIVGALPNVLAQSPVTALNPGVHRIQTSQGIVLDLVE